MTNETIPWANQKAGRAGLAERLNTRAGYREGVMALLLVGLALRAVWVARSDFPLNDGGLFYTMIRDLQANHYALPWNTSYNGGQIPFAYPPLGFYLAAFLNQATGLSVLDILRFLPLIFNMLTALAVLALARELLPTRVEQLLAMGAYLALPMSSPWLIMGGGLTRSLGLLFAVLAIHRAYLLYNRADRSDIVLTTVYSACAVLSHPEMAWFAFYSIALMFLAFGRDRRGSIHSIAAMAGVAALTAPWWGTVLARHGLSAFLASISGSAQQYPVVQSLLELLWNPTGEALFPILAAFGLLGALFCIARGRALLPAWTLAVFLLNTRSAYNIATVPLSMLVGLGIQGGCDRFSSAWRLSGPLGRVRPVVGWLVVALVLVSAILRSWALLKALTPEERQAMAWVADNTAESSKFLVTPLDPWESDRSSEWFPALAQRVSVATVQGSEFSTGGDFGRRIERSRLAGVCLLSGDAACLESWSQGTGLLFDYIYLPKRACTWPQIEQAGDEDCSKALQRSLDKDSSYFKVFENPGAAIYERRNG